MEQDLRFNNRTFIIAIKYVMDTKGKVANFIFGLGCFFLFYIYLSFDAEKVNNTRYRPYQSKGPEDLHIQASKKDGGNTKTRKDGTQTTPHIIFILADDLGWADVGFHGRKTNTPFIDELANTGVKLGNYYAQPNCSPSRASFLTGKYSDRTGIQHALRGGQKTCLPLYHTILPETLRTYGYSTHLIGKWHLGYCREDCLPFNRGFDTFFGMLGGSNDLISHTSGGLYDMWERDRPAYEVKGNYSAEIYGQKTVELINNYKSEGKQNPIFLFLSFQIPHEPQMVPEKYINKWPNYANVTPKRKQKLYGQVSCMDEIIQQVVAALKTKQIWNNTILIFSSDNGGPFVNGASNIPLRGQKRTHFEGGTRVVGFVTSPLLSENVRGTTFNGLMGMADWFPTFIDGVAGGSTKHIDIDGMNVWSSLRNGTPSPRTDYVISVGEECLKLPYRNNTVYWDRTGVDPRTSVRSGPWKLIVKQGDKDPLTMPEEVHLYNIEEDEGETNNLAADNEGVVKELRRRVREYCDKTVPIVSFIGDKAKKSRTLVEPWGCTLDTKYVSRELR